jgi:hypothetical protein
MTTDDDDDDVHEAQTKVGEVSSEILRLVRAFDEAPPSSGGGRPTPPVGLPAVAPSSVERPSAKNSASAVPAEIVEEAKAGATAAEAVEELTDDDVLPDSMPEARAAPVVAPRASAPTPSPIDPEPSRVPELGAADRPMPSRWYSDLRLGHMVLAILPAALLLVGWLLYQAMSGP